MKCGQGYIEITMFVELYCPQNIEINLGSI